VGILWSSSHNLGTGHSGSKPKLRLHLEVDEADTLKLSHVLDFGYDSSKPCADLSLDMNRYNLNVEFSQKR